MSRKFYFCCLLLTLFLGVLIYGCKSSPTHYTEEQLVLVKRGGNGVVTRSRVGRAIQSGLGKVTNGVKNLFSKKPNIKNDYVYITDGKMHFTSKPKSGKAGEKEDKMIRKQGGQGHRQEQVSKATPQKAIPTATAKNVGQDENPISRQQSKKGPEDIRWIGGYNGYVVMTPNGAQPA